MTISNRAGKQRWRHSDDDGDVTFWRERETRRLWREACEGAGLCQWIPTPSGWTLATPRVGHITLGDPTSMSVALRAGQMLSDVIAVAPRIAYAMGVGSLRVTAMSAPTWLRVELLNGPGPGPDDGVVTPMRRPTVLPPTEVGGNVAG